MIETTTLSFGCRPVTTVVNNTSYPTHLRHALIIDLKRNANTDIERDLPKLRNQLQTMDTQSIDMLQIRDDSPSDELWQSLSNFKKISHLEILCGFDELCNILPLDDIGASWPLQSIVISGAAGDFITTAHLNTITSLTLDYCAGLLFDRVHSNVKSNLRHLVIIENDACDTFIKLNEEFANFFDNLSELTIKSTNGCDFCHQYEKEAFGRALSQCSSLRSLDLTLHDPSEELQLQLPTCFPINIEILRFYGPSTLANNLSTWQTCMSDSNWLPNLKSIRFVLTETVDQRTTQLLNHFISLRPFVTIN